MRSIRISTYDLPMFEAAHRLVADVLHQQKLSMFEAFIRSLDRGEANSPLVESIVIAHRAMMEAAPLSREAYAKLATPVVGATSEDDADFEGDEIEDIGDEDKSYAEPGNLSEIGKTDKDEPVDDEDEAGGSLEAERQLRDRMLASRQNKQRSDKLYAELKNVPGLSKTDGSGNAQNAGMASQIQSWLDMFNAAREVLQKAKVSGSAEVARLVSRIGADAVSELKAAEVSPESMINDAEYFADVMADRGSDFSPKVRAYVFAKQFLSYRDEIIKRVISTLKDNAVYASKRLKGRGIELEPEEYVSEAMTDIIYKLDSGKVNSYQDLAKSVFGEIKRPGSYLTKAETGEMQAKATAWNPTANYNTDSKVFVRDGSSRKYYIAARPIPEMWRAKGDYMEGDVVRFANPKAPTEISQFKLLDDQVKSAPIDSTGEVNPAWEEVGENVAPGKSDTYWHEVTGYSSKVSTDTQVSDGDGSSQGTLGDMILPASSQDDFVDAPVGSEQNVSDNPINPAAEASDLTDPKIAVHMDKVDGVVDSAFNRFLATKEAEDLDPADMLAIGAAKKVVKDFLIKSMDAPDTETKFGSDTGAAYLRNPVERSDYARKKARLYILKNLLRDPAEVTEEIDDAKSRLVDAKKSLQTLSAENAAGQISKKDYDTERKNIQSNIDVLEWVVTNYITADDIKAINADKVAKAERLKAEIDQRKKSGKLSGIDKLEARLDRINSDIAGTNIDGIQDRIDALESKLGLVEQGEKSRMSPYEELILGESGPKLGAPSFKQSIDSVTAEENARLAATGQLPTFSAGKKKGQARNIASDAVAKATNEFVDSVMSDPTNPLAIWIAKAGGSKLIPGAKTEKARTGSMVSTPGARAKFARDVEPIRPYMDKISDLTGKQASDTLEDLQSAETEKLRGITRAKNIERAEGMARVSEPQAFSKSQDPAHRAVADSGVSAAKQAYEKFMQGGVNVGDDTADEIADEATRLGNIERLGPKTGDRHTRAP